MAGSAHVYEVSTSMVDPLIKGTCSRCCKGHAGHLCNERQMILIYMNACMHGDVDRRAHFALCTLPVHFCMRTIMHAYLCACFSPMQRSCPNTYAPGLAMHLVNMHACKHTCIHHCTSQEQVIYTHHLHQVSDAGARFPCTHPSHHEARQRTHGVGTIRSSHPAQPSCLGPSKGREAQHANPLRWEIESEEWRGVCAEEGRRGKEREVVDGLHARERAYFMCLHLASCIRQRIFEPSTPSGRYARLASSMHTTSAK